MDQKNAFLGTEPIGRLLFRLAVPTVIAQLVNMLYNIVDRIYIGHMPQVGSLALTGLGVCTPIILIVSAFAALVASGGAPRASISMGKGDLQTAEKMLGGCFSLQLGISAVLTAALLIWNRDLLLAFGASEQTIDYAADYMQIYAIGTVFVQLTLGMNAFITAQGFAREGMLTVLIGAVCNIVLDPILIFRLGMGVRGAALATIVSQGVSCLWVVLFLFSKKSVLKLRVQNFLQSPRLILPCVGLGTATFIMQASESVLSVCFNSSLARYGGEVCCFMSDEDVAETAKKNGTTRAVASMEKAAALDKKIIFAIGNAPTALVRLYELIQDGKLTPELIIGVPVGFVNVVQSKELILSLKDTPYIVARGRKGGSNIAACICNALLYML